MKIMYVLICLSMLLCVIYAPRISAVNYQISVITDRPSYEPGFFVNISGQLTLDDGTPVAGEYVGIEIVGPDMVTGFQPLTDANGYYYTYFEVKNTSLLGTYTVRVAKGYARDNTTFDVVETAPNLPPYIPRNPNPSNESIGVSLTPTLTWDGGDPDPGDTVTYDIYFGETSPPPLVVPGQSDATYSPSALDESTMYDWRIVSYDTNGSHTTGPVWRFTTEAITNEPPATPSIPQGPTTGYHGTSYTYNVSTIDPDGDNVYYQFSWIDGTYSEWLGPFSSNQQVQVSHRWDFPGCYNISVRAKDVEGAESDWSSALPVCIYNRAPFIPSSPSPANASINQQVSSVLQWSGGDPDTDDVVTYDVYFGTSTPLLKKVNRQARMSFDPALTYDAIYYWQIVAWDSNNTSVTGPLWHFRTASDSSSGGNGVIDDDQSGEEIQQENDTKIPPTARFTISPVTAHTNTLITCNASSSTDDGFISSWIWDFGDNATSSGEIVTHSYATMGSYTIRLTVEDDDGLMSQSSNTITITPWILFDVDLTIVTDSVNVCENLSAIVQFINVGDTGAINATVMYTLSEDTELCYSETEQISIQTIKSVNKSFDTCSFSPGVYTLSVYLYYGNSQTASASAVVTITQASSDSNGFSWIFLIISFCTIIILSIVFIMFKGKKR